MKCAICGAQAAVMVELGTERVPMCHECNLAGEDEGLFEWYAEPVREPVDDRTPSRWQLPLFA